MNINEVREIINKAIAENATELNLSSSRINMKLTQNDLIKLIPDIIKLRNLSVLYLYDNQISEIPKEIFQLKNLRELNLSGNKFSEIPKEISQLQNLQIISLRDNQVREIPKEINQLRNLRELILYGNAGLEKKIPAEILNDSGNPQKILNYYFTIKEDKTRPINEAKIVVIGEANVGKTCLINRLILDKVLPTISTHGIEIRQWESRMRRFG